MKTYAEKLKDPRWQRRRLEIMERDGFMCQTCRSEEETLHVHHWKYSQDPWMADDGDLVTLCHKCHGRVEACKTEFYHALKTCAASCQDVGFLSSVIEAIGDTCQAGKHQERFIKYISSADTDPQVEGVFISTGMMAARDILSMRDSYVKANKRKKQFA